MLEASSAHAVPPQRCVRSCLQATFRTGMQISLRVLSIAALQALPVGQCGRESEEEDVTGWHKCVWQTICIGFNRHVRPAIPMGGDDRR